MQRPLLEMLEGLAEMSGLRGGGLLQRGRLPGLLGRLQARPFRDHPGHLRNLQQRVREVLCRRAQVHLLPRDRQQVPDCLRGLRQLRCRVCQMRLPEHVRGMQQQVLSYQWQLPGLRLGLPGLLQRCQLVLCLLVSVLFRRNHLKGVL
jgi:hypothetical protein